MPPHVPVIQLALLLFSLSATAQQPTPAVETLPSGIARLTGKDASSGIAYTRLFLTNAPPPAPHSAGTPQVPVPDADLTLPTLTVQCTQSPNGKFRFELFVNFGGITDPAFYPPWHPTPTEQFPPPTEKVILTMEFLGYTKVKPVKHQFEMVPPAANSGITPPEWVPAISKRSRSTSNTFAPFQPSISPAPPKRQPSPPRPC